MRYSGFLSSMRSNAINHIRKISGCKAELLTMFTEKEMAKKKAKDAVMLCCRYSTDFEVINSRLVKGSRHEQVD